MIYADTDFFLALLKPKDWLKERAKEIKKKYDVTTSVVTFIELMLLCKRYNLDPIRVTADVMAIMQHRRREIAESCNNVFDAFHAAYCGGTIISSDSVFDRLGIKRIRLED